MFILYRLTFPRGFAVKRVPTGIKPASLGWTCMNESCWALLSSYLHCSNGFPELIMLFQHFISGEAEKEPPSSGVNIGWN